MSKNRKLIIGIFLDLCGMISYVIPMFDIIWAPISAFLMTRMYKGRKGRVAAIINFIEEALPYTDIIPTFTLMWFYVYVFSKSPEVNRT